MTSLPEDKIYELKKYTPGGSMYGGRSQAKPIAYKSTATFRELNNRLLVSLSSQRLISFKSILIEIMNPNVELRNFLRLAACRSERKLNEIKVDYDKVKIENQNLKKKEHLLSEKLVKYDQIQADNEELKRNQQMMSEKLDKYDQIQADNEELKRNQHLLSEKLVKYDQIQADNEELKRNQQMMSEKLDEYDQIQADNEELKRNQQMMSDKLEDLALTNDQLTKNWNGKKVQLEKMSSENSKLLEAHNKQRNKKKVTSGSKPQSVSAEKSAGIRKQPSVKKPAWNSSTKIR